MGIINWLISHPQLLIAALVIFGPIVGRIIKILSAQAAKRNAEVARERAQIDALRTGRRIDPAAGMVRTSQGEAQSARASLEDLANRRRTELGGTLTPTAPVDLPSSIRRQPTTRTQPMRTQPPRKVARAASPEPRQQTSQRQPRAQRAPAAAPTYSPQLQTTSAAPGARPRPLSDDFQDEVDGVARVAQVARVAGVAAVATIAPLPLADGRARAANSRASGLGTQAIISAKSLRDASPDLWRRAFVMQEVLAKPAALRDGPAV